ncbi:unnamed protein product [Lymnaea stagnalis]|uniref:Uncharacterized protein n=1 Tax=Lymnaea stagnalis TaxID=6523 RepID=A0AAV2HIE8_LYMST
MPRTTADAEHNGFKKIGGCDTTAHWRGQRYIKNDDYAVVLLYDIHGFIAGIQTTVPKDQGRNYPKPPIEPPFVSDGNRWVISAYFVDPSTICTKGRTVQEFNAEGTGTNLYIQNSTSPEHSVLIPHKEADIRGTKWVEGNCFLTMGKHYWYNLKADMSCDTVFPVFLLYNHGELTAFGWALITNLTSTRYEHPTPSSFGLHNSVHHSYSTTNISATAQLQLHPPYRGETDIWICLPKIFFIKIFMKTVPTCLNTAGVLSTMHIYLTGNYALDTC